MVLAVVCQKFFHKTWSIIWLNWKFDARKINKKAFRFSGVSCGYNKWNFFLSSDLIKFTAPREKNLRDFDDFQKALRYNIAIWITWRFITINEKKERENHRSCIFERKLKEKPYEPQISYYFLNVEGYSLSEMLHAVSFVLLASCVTVIFFNLGS